MPRSAVLALTGRRAIRSGLLWGALFGAIAVGSASGFASAYDTPAARAKLAASFEGNVGLSGLMGVPHRLETVGGFVAWRAIGFLVVVAAVWGLLTATRALRGEEEAGRWQLLLAGPITRGRATGQVLTGLGAGVAALWAGAWLGTIAAGRSVDDGFGVGAAAYLAAAVAAGALVFAAVGAVASQLTHTRRAANMLGATVLGAAYLVRMVADTSPDRAWVRWASPLGWIEALRPLTGSRAGAFVPLMVAVVVLGTLAVGIAARRDDGDAPFGAARSDAGSTALLGSPAGLAARLTVPVAAGWAVGFVAIGVVAGIVGREAARAYAGSDSVDRVLERLGGNGGDASVLGVIFLTAATLLGVCAAGLVTAVREEEAAGRTDHLLAHPIDRRRWLAGRLTMVAVVVVAGGLVLGLATWVGELGHAEGVGLGRLLEAGVNVVPPSLFVLGIVALTFAVAPRHTARVAYAVILWSFVVEFVAALVDSSPLLLDTSLLHHLAPAPAADPRWVPALVMTGLGLLGAAVAVQRFTDRDLAGS